MGGYYCVSLYLMSLSINRVMTAKQFSCICVEQFHRNTARGMAMPSSINEIDSIKSCRISSTISTFPDFTLINHVTNFPSSGDLVYCFLRRCIFISLWKANENQKNFVILQEQRECFVCRVNTSPSSTKMQQLYDNQFQSQFCL